MKKVREEVSAETQGYYFSYYVTRIPGLTSKSCHNFKVKCSIDDLTSFDFDISLRYRPLSEETVQKTGIAAEVVQALT